jgi:hypothetical protein
MPCRANSHVTCCAPAVLRPKASGTWKWPLTLSVTEVSLYYGGHVATLLTDAGRQNMWPNDYPIQKVSGGLSPKVKLPGHKANHSPPSYACDKNEWSSTSILICLHGFVRWYKRILRLRMHIPRTWYLPLAFSFWNFVLCTLWRQKAFRNFVTLTLQYHWVSNIVI